MWCWGLNERGQLGDGTTDAHGPRALPDLTATALGLGDQHSCALVAGGQYTCWGANGSGQLGDNSGISRLRPTAPAVAGPGLIALTAGASHTCGLATDRSIWCWGLDADGELGNNDVASARLPLMSAPGPFQAVAAGREHTCAVRADGSVACWGRGASGQIGAGIIAVWSPTPVALPGAATAIDAGADHACALVGGVPYCWGDDHNSQLGDGGTQAQPRPHRRGAHRRHADRHRRDPHPAQSPAP